MARKNIKRPRLNSRKRRKLRYAAANPSSKEVLLGFYDNVINHLEDLQEGLATPNEEVIRLDEGPVLKTGADEESV